MGKTKKKKVRASTIEENPRAKRIFNISVGLQLWITLLGAIIAISAPFRTETYDPFFMTIQIATFVLFASGIYAVWSAHPPFHYLLFLGAGLNFIINLLLIIQGNSLGLLQASLSFLILYVGYRYPLQFTENQVTFGNR